MALESGTQRVLNNGTPYEVKVHVECNFAWCTISWCYFEVVLTENGAETVGTWELSAEPLRERAIARIKHQQLLNNFHV